MSNDEHIKLREKVSGTWLLPWKGERTATLVLNPEGWMRMTVPATTGGGRIKQVLSGDTVTGNWALVNRARERTLLESSVQGSARIGSSSFIPDILSGAKQPSSAAKGPFILLNIQDVPKAIANVRLFGVRIDAANIVVAADEVGGGRYIKVMDSSQTGTELTVRMPDGTVQTWQRIR